jgi:hypothetical protein
MCKLFTHRLIASVYYGDWWKDDARKSASRLEDLCHTKKCFHLFQFLNSNMLRQARKLIGSMGMERSPKI